MQKACDLAESFIAGNLDPDLAGNTESLTLGINLQKEIQGEVRIHALFRDILSGKICGTVFPFPLTLKSRRIRERISIHSPSCPAQRKSKDAIPFTFGWFSQRSCLSFGVRKSPWLHGGTGSYEAGGIFGWARSTQPVVPAVWECVA